MDFNALSGSIPSELYNLVELRELDLNDNFLGGVLEDGIGGLVNLMYLQLDQNEFTGTLPREVGELKELGECLYLCCLFVYGLFLFKVIISQLLSVI